jgi:[ribosomal protein S5]-alanine N-acetyltransferase
MIFETERLYVRAYTWEDFEDFFRLNHDPEVMKYIRPPQSYEVAKEFFKKILDAYTTQPLFGRWGVYDRTTGAFVGSFAIIPIEKSTHVQLGYALLKENWGRGYASELTRHGIEYYFSKTDSEILYALAETGNLLSHKVLLKNGFIPDIKLMEAGKELQRFFLMKKDSQIGTGS